jgi:hypothetical protein
MRWWLIGVVCLCCGVASRAAFVWAGQNSKLDYVTTAFFEFICYIPGLILLRLDLERFARDHPFRTEDVLDRRIIWWAVAVGCLVALWSSCCGGW